jgi:predicted nucleic acid-binding protein
MLVAIDSNVFVGALSTKEEHSSNAQQLIRDVASGKYKAIASSIVYGEVYSVSVSSQQVDLEGFFSQISNLVTIPAGDSICIRAGELRLKFGSKLKLPDALHLATALSVDANLFITNDEKLANVSRELISTKLLSQLH